MIGDGVPRQMIGSQQAVQIAGMYQGRRSDHLDGSICDQDGWADSLGAVNLYYTLEIVHRQVTGFELVYQFPRRISLGTDSGDAAGGFVGIHGPGGLRGPHESR
jgi:hypothetical protein